jgi:hypothetical protein
MSKAVPSKPPPQSARRAYVLTTTSRVPGRVGEPRPTGGSDLHADDPGRTPGEPGQAPGA